MRILGSPGLLALSVVGLISPATPAPQAPPAGGAAARGAAPTTSAGPARWTVQYRTDETKPWQLYTTTRRRDNADQIASELREAGYHAQVVDDSTPVPAPLEDLSEYRYSYAN